MKVTEQPCLKNLNSFGVQARAELGITVEQEEDLLEAPAFDPSRDLIMGGGSNLLLVTDVPGTVYLNRMRGVALVEQDDTHALLEVGAGENWHDLVRWTLDRGLSGLENLSLIPGLAGAAPVQNIGAYGVELSSVLDSITAWDWRRGGWVSLSAGDCGLAYRDSLFKSAEPDRYFITSMRLRLDRRFNPQLSYPGLAEELAAAGVAQPSARDVSDAVIRIRRRRLPDPSAQGNAGSFFKNPSVTTEVADTLLSREPGMPRWPAARGLVKLSAAWLVERCGLKGHRLGGALVSRRHALVIVNDGAATGAEIAALANHVQAAVLDRFGIRLEPEPRIVEF